MQTTAFSAALLLAALSFSHAARAQEARPKAYESPQHFAIEFRLGQYYPEVDSEFSGATPFQQAYGSKRRWLVGGEFDWQALRIPYVGTLGPGAGLHWTKFNGSSLFADGSGEADESTSFTLMPMHLVAVLRVDVLAREIGIPLVPYIKGGLGAAYWRQTNGGGTARIRDAAGNVTMTGKGLSFGPQFAFGAMFLLDWLDPYAAQQADNTLGVNNTYLYFELFMSKLNWALNGPGLYLGETSGVAGLAFEF